ncbi:MAG: hypothetical protein WC718_18255, partial [Phycisphaerales bacterium]
MNRMIALFVAAFVAWWVPATQAQPTAAPATPVVQAAERANAFSIVLDPSVVTKPFTGRVYVVLSIDSGEPRRRMGDWFGKTQVLAVDVKDAAPGTAVAVGEGALAFPKTFADAMNKEYRVQAVAKVNPDCPRPGEGEGDLYSDVTVATFAKDGKALELKLTHAVAAKTFKETERVKVFEMNSPSLSAFYGRPLTLRAGVVLPKGYSTEKHY